MVSYTRCHDNTLYHSKGGPGAMGQGSTGTVGMYVKIDRPAGIISFKHPRAPEVVLSDWSSDVRYDILSYHYALYLQPSLTHHSTSTNISFLFLSFYGSKMMTLMESTCHLINRECMVHKV